NLTSAFPATKRLQIALANNPETEIVAGVVWHIGATRCCPQAVEARLPAPAPIDPFRARTRSSRVVFGSAAVGFHEVAAPFPDIPRHVFHSEGTGAARQRSDWPAFCEAH